MKKKVAVLAVDPVNGAGLFQYLESFYEKGISYKVFAVSDPEFVRIFLLSDTANSGITLLTDDLIANLKSHADEFDALLFSCGDAVPVFQQNANRDYNIDLLSVVREFSDKNKLMIGHCAASLIFEIAGITEGKRLAVHPLAKPAIQKGIATNDAVTIDGNFYTAQDEHAIPQLIPCLLEVLQ